MEENNNQVYYGGTAPVPPTQAEDAYIRRIDEMAREREEEKKPKKASLFARFLGFLLLAIVIGVVGGGTYYGIERYLGDSETESTSKKDNSRAAKQSGELAPTKAIELAQSGEPGDTKATPVTAVDVSAVVDSVMPAVVAINSFSTVTRYDFWSGQSTDSEQALGSGSGIIIGQNSGEVLIVTNNHVVSGANRVEIVFCDESKAQAIIKGTSATSDLAVVAVPFSELTSETASLIRVARIGDSDSVKVGQMAIAIGNALGYGQSVTVGYISALNREVTVENVTYTLIQTDAAINPGNSGGALLNQYGEVIGINSVKYSNYSVEGMGFAIPISNVREIIENLSNREQLDDSEKGFLGIAMSQDVTGSYSTMLDMPQGVYVQELVSDSPAEKGGMRPGDIITKIGNEKISGIGDVQEIMSYTRAGTEITVTVARRAQNGEFEETELKITLGSYEDAVKSQKKRQ